VGELTVDKLYDQLQHGFHGCSMEQHRQKLDQHMDTVNDNHSLDDIFNDTEDQEMTQATRRSSRVAAKEKRRESSGLERKGRFLGVFISNHNRGV